MQILFVYATSVLTIFAVIAHADDNTVAPDAANIDNIYNNVIAGELQQAANQLLELDTVQHSNFIVDMVNKLIREKKKSVFDIAYKLWVGTGQDIVKKHYPEQFRLILAGETVKLVFKRDNQALKLAAKTDRFNDRMAYGDASDKTSDNVGWKFTPLRHSGHLFFTIKNIKRNQYLKLANEPDSDGDRIAYGADEFDTDRHYWYLVPAMHDGEVLFFIYNARFSRALKLGRSVDSDGDRIVYGTNDDVTDYPEHYGFSISAL